MNFQFHMERLGNERVALSLSVVFGKLRRKAGRLYIRHEDVEPAISRRLLLLQINRCRKQYVVLQVDVLFEVGVELRQLVV